MLAVGTVSVVAACAPESKGPAAPACLSYCFFRLRAPPSETPFVRMEPLGQTRKGH